MKEITKENIIDHLNSVYEALNKRSNQVRGIHLNTPGLKLIQKICDQKPNDKN